ncbi:MAG: hypothetical protein ACXVAY_05750 [Mucilaginibacter sp.]
MRVFIYVFTMMALFVSCNRNSNRNHAIEDKQKANRDQYRYINTLKAKKRHLDELGYDTNKVIVLVKVPGSQFLKTVKQGKFPEDVETTYNLLKDAEGNIVFILESPTSESGDWDIVYTNYFDKKGRLFCFERAAGFFNSGCTDEAAHETLTKYYNNKFQVIDSAYTLLDSHKKPLKKSACVFNYDYPYNVIASLAEYLKKNNIKLASKP